MTDEEFYTKCGEVLGTQALYKPFPYYKRTRWNNRSAGSGRYEGNGVIRVFGENLIHVALKNPNLLGSFTSKDLAIAAIIEAMDK